MLNTAVERHSLLLLTPQGAQYAWENKGEPYPPSFEISGYKDIFFRLPAIARFVCGGEISVGFSFPIINADGRLRVASKLPISCISGVISPWMVIECCGCGSLPSAFSAPLNELELAARSLDIRLGVFGSAALGALTKLPYVHDRSDLDIVITAAPPETLASFSSEVKEVSKKYGITIDAEVKFGHEAWVKLPEILSGRGSVLVKGGHQPEVAPSSDIWGILQV